MRNIPQALLSFFVLDVALAQIDNSVCRHPTGVYEKGNVDCLGGEVFLRGNYVEVGIHEVGSYGTYNKAPGGSAYAGKNLGFIADFGRDGWGVASTKYPYGKFAGDYFVPGSPVEGTQLYGCECTKAIFNLCRFVQAGFCSGRAVMASRRVDSKKA